MKFKFFDQKSNAFTLLEVLLAVVIAAAIIVFSIKYYLGYQRRTNDALIKSDVKIISNALNNYYHERGCNENNGFFAGNPSPDIVTDLKLAEHYKKRYPYVEKYSAEIKWVDSIKEDRPIYDLVVKAEFKKTLSQERMRWYQQKLNAADLSNHTLTWVGLPTLSSAKSGDGFWVMQGSREKFKRALSVNTGKKISGSYCAH